MANFAYLQDSNNLVKQAQLQASSEDSNYPVSNIIVLPVSKPWRSAEGGISGVKVRVDFAAAQSIDAVALINHNLTSGATITLRGGTSPDPDGSEFSTTITWVERTAWKFLSPAQSWRYWTLLLTDEAQTTGFLQVGYLVMGAQTTLAFNFAPDWALSRMTAVRRNENEFGVPMTGALLSKWTQLGISFTTRTDAEKSTLETFLEALDKDAGPLLFVPNSAESEAFFGRLIVDYTTRRFAKWNDITDLQFREDAHGTIVTEPPPFHYEP